MSGVQECEKLGVKAKAFQANFAEFDPVLRLADEASEFLGRVDVLVNNAGHHGEQAVPQDRAGRVREGL